MKSKFSGLLGSALKGGPSIGETKLEGGQVMALVGHGLDEVQQNVCPGTNDWEQTMLNDDKNNIHARVLKSVGRKLAVVAFRGTKMTSLKNWLVDANAQTV